VTFHGLGPIRPKSNVERRRAIAWLEKFYPGIVSCRVAISVPHRHRSAGRRFHVTVRADSYRVAKAKLIQHEPSLARIEGRPSRDSI
jgi:hypothetical protein